MRNDFRRKCRLRDGFLALPIFLLFLSMVGKNANFGSYHVISTIPSMDAFRNVNRGDESKIVLHVIILKTHKQSFDSEP